MLARKIIEIILFRKILANSSFEGLLPLCDKIPSLLGSAVLLVLLVHGFTKYIFNV